MAFQSITRQDNTLELAHCITVVVSLVINAIDESGLVDKTLPAPTKQ
jgi:hypothetical protein